MPGPGHPGHFPKPPGWVDRPGAPGGGQPPASRAEEATAKLADLLGLDEMDDEMDDEVMGEVMDEVLGDEDSDEIDDQVDVAEAAVAGDIQDLSAIVAARDEYLDSLRRLQADFENYKKRIQRQQAELSERAAEALVEKLLPALDTFDLALAHADGPVDAGLQPIYRSLLGVLTSAGLDRLDPQGQPFDPNEHDAVQHEEGGDSPTPEVIEVLRAGYRWKGRVMRPAMVKVKG